MNELKKTISGKDIYLRREPTIDDDSSWFELSVRLSVR